MPVPTYDFKSAFNDRYSAITKKMLRVLSDNSRVSLSDLSKTLGVSRMTARSKLNRIEKELSLAYTVELSESTLGIVGQHLIMVKFDSKPDYGHISKLLSQSHIPQLAVSVKGNYDLMIYAVSTSTKEYAHWDKSMQILLSKYGVNWKSSEVVHKQLGFFPLRDVLLDRLNIPKDHLAMLKILHSNSRTSFRQISKDLGMHFNTVAYNFNKLLKKGYIKRFTITMGKPDFVSLMSFFSKYRPKEGYEASSSQARKAFTSDDPNSLISRYLICAPLIGSYDFFTIGAFDDYNTAYQNDVMYHKTTFKDHGVNLVYGEIDNILLGKLPIRSIDTKKEYNKIVWNTEDTV